MFEYIMSINKKIKKEEYFKKVAFSQERSLDGFRLGRHVEHDSRSRKYAVQIPSKLVLRTTMHSIMIPVLDQGEVGACTGFATLACVGSNPFYSKIPSTNNFKPNFDVQRDQNLALEIYRRATIIDEFPGFYPEEDTGSSGLAVAKVAKSVSLISSYKHAFGFEAAMTALMKTPIIVGVNWYEGFDYPNSKGFVKVAGRPRGGHEFCLFGLDATKKIVYARNSWGKGWGSGGNFSFSFSDLRRLLLEYGDATVFVPLASKSK